MIQPELKFSWGVDEHASTLHPAHTSGFVAICRKDKTAPKDKDWKQTFKTPQDLIAFLREYKYRTDVYISQNRFYKGNSRKKAKVEFIGACWVDLDYYNTDLKSYAPEYVFGLCRERCFQNQIPEPLGIFSGCGIYLVWFVSAHVKKGGIEAWEIIQKFLLDLFRDLGADPKAIDGSRVLRLAGTKNSKSNKYARVLGGSDHLWQLKDFYNEILGPLANLPKEELKKRFAVHPVQNPETGLVSLKNVVKLQEIKPYRHVMLTAKSLWSRRQAEIIELIQHRWPTGVPEGYRDTCVFLLAVSISWTYPWDFHNELEGVFQEVYCQNWTERDTRGSISSVLNRLALRNQDLGFMYQGRPTDPRYRFRSDTIVDWLGITEHEAKALNLRLLAPKNIRRENKLELDKSRNEKLRRSQGMLTRDEWLETVQNDPANETRTRPWEALGISRRWYYTLKKQGKLPKNKKT